MENIQYLVQVRWSGNFLIFASAVFIESRWFPEFEVHRHDGFLIPKQRTASVGFTERNAAVEVAVKFAIDEINYWRLVPPQKGF